MSISPRTQAVLIALLLFGARPLETRAQSLPVPCGGSTCAAAGGPQAWVTSGSASAVLGQNSLRITQSTENATLNWSSFNVDAGHSVTFDQPSANAVALNRIFQADPSRILGVLDANGRVYLLNQNGIVFGDGAQANVGGLIASSLDITPEALENGIVRAADVALAPAFSLHRDSAGTLPSGDVRVEAGAVLTADGGQILLLAPEVSNEGRILTPGGQTVLAAGDSVYLVTNTDANFRGLVVEVSGDGVVTNGTPGATVGEVIAERGNVTLAGLAVNQLGRVSATTTVRENGSIRLMARSGTSAVRSGAGAELVPTVTGSLVLGEQSTTEVALAAGSETAVDVTEQPKSTVLLEGYRVDALGGARVAAQGGQIEVTARSSPQIAPPDFGAPTDNRIYLADGVTFDVSGAAVELPMERNAVRVELRGNQLRDSPEQRDGPLRGSAVIVDARRSGVRPDGSAWQGTPLADASGELSNVERDVRERNLVGGTVRLQSAGDVIVDDGAAIDVSGGSVSFRGGFVRTSQLLTEDGHIVDVGSADRDRRYVAIVDGFVREHERWGITETFTGIFGRGHSQFEAGYVEGRDAGSLAVLAPRFVLDGTLQGEVAVGPRQRQPEALSASERVPQGALLVIGSPTGGSSSEPNYVTQAMEIAAGRTLPASLTVSRVPLHNLGPGRATRVRLFGNESIDVPAGTRLDLGGGGQFTATAATVTVAGDITAPSGTVEIAAGPTISRPLAGLALVIEPTAGIDVSGLWVNDNPQLNPAGATAPLFIDGGSVAIEGSGLDVDVRRGSVIDVSGGAWRTRDGHIVPGTGGSISVSAAGLLETPSVLGFNATFSAHALSEGGRLSLTASAFCIALEDCRDGDASTFWLHPGAIAATGLGALSLTSNLRGITLEAGTQLAAMQTNLTLPANSALVPTGTPLRAFSGTARLPDAVREPFSLSMTVNALPGFGLLFDRDSFADAGILHLESGSLIDADTASSVLLRANTRVQIDGTVRAPAGEIDVRLTPGARIGDFLPTQGIHLTDRARLEVPGSVVRLPNDQDLDLAEVLPGGTISIHADRGFVALSPESLIDVGGAAATLDVRSGPGAFESRQIASAGGHLDISAAEAVLLSGSVSASGGSADVQGGSLHVLIDGNTRGIDPGAVDPVMPLESRQIVITDSDVPLVVGPGAPLSPDAFGRAVVPAQLIESAGFAVVDLAARNLLSSRLGVAFLASMGRVAFEGNPRLVADARISLDAPEFVSNGGRAELAAPYIALGNGDRGNQTAPDILSFGDGELVVNAGAALDLVGRSTFQGFSRLLLTAVGDIRARGVQRIGERSLQGSLTTLADLTLRAAQIYPTTLTDFAFVIGDGTTGTLATEAGGVARPVMSAGGSLHLDAARIEHGGVLRAPFGELSLEANELTLAPGSILSTAADTATTLFGFIQVDDWVYGLDDTELLVFRDGFEALPGQQIVLTSPQVDFRDGAVIDVSGGGDLLGYQFIPGVGGSVDVLSPAVDPHTFAIVPGLDLDVAPFDPLEYAGSPLEPGDSIYLAGIEGLPAGSYQLLPARYALLPGAFLVTPTEGYQDILPGERYSADGGTIIAGRREAFGRGTADSRSSGFLVRPGTEAQRRAQYEIYGANEFFSEQVAQSDSPAPRLPVDAGRLSIVAEGMLALEGILDAAAAAGGRNAELELTGNDLRIVADAGNTVATPGQVLIDADQLNALGAGSVLIGGSRERSQGATDINAAASVVTLDPSVTVAAAEVMLVARDRIDIGADARLVATASPASAAEDLAISGDAALLRVSGGPQANLLRSGETRAAGTLNLAQGATLSAPGGSAILSASRDTVSAALFDLGAGALTLGASNITLGSPSAPASGLVLDDAALAAFGGLDSLMLASASSIDIAGDVQFAVGGELTLDAAGMRTLGAGTSRIAARELRLQNSAARAALAAIPSSGGALELEAAQVAFGGGDFQVLGGSELRVSADQQFQTERDGRLAIDGAVWISTASFTSESGTDLDLQVGGALEFLGVAAAAEASAASDPALGATLRASADAIRVATRIDLPSGRLVLTARGAGGVSLVDGGVLDLRGVVTVFDGVAVGSPGGSAALIADTGSVNLGAGSVVDVGAGTVGDAGRVDLRASAGSVRMDGAIRGAAAPDFRGGSIAVDALDPGSLDSLSATFADSGFRDAISVRRRGAGSLELGAASVLRARDVDLVADQGSIAIRGTIDASGADGGDVTISAGSQIRVTGTIDARAEAAEGEGGRVALSVGESGALLLEAAASLDVTGETPGEVLLRAPRGAALSVLDADAGNDRLRVDASIQGADRVDAEFYSVASDADGVLSAAEIAASAANPLFADTQAFMTNAAALETALNPDGGLGLEIRPGIEIRRAGDLVLSTDWNLFPWRFTGSDGTPVPGTLTLRASGNLTFQRVLSDGFAAASGAAGTLLTSTDESWSYRLAAGADLGSADPLAVIPQLERGDLIVGAGTAAVENYIRTGTGRIDIAAGRDLRLTNQFSTIYTAGIGQPGAIYELPGGFGARLYPTRGGDIDVAAARDIVAVRGNQLVTSWLWRLGQGADGSDMSPAWTVAFDQFDQGIGALAGGDIRIAAGRDITELSASIPTIGRQVGGVTNATSDIEIGGGGDLEVSAGGSIRGGSYYVGRGDAEIVAGGSIGAVAGSFNPVVALSDGSVALRAVGDVSIESVLDPMLLPQSTAQAPITQTRSQHVSYSPTARVDVTSIGGTVSLRGDSTANGLRRQLTSMAFRAGDEVALRLYPATLRAAAMRGDVLLPHSLSLAPAPKGNLELFAYHDVRADAAANVGWQLVVSDADSTLLPTFDDGDRDALVVRGLLGSSIGTIPGFNAPVPVHALASQPDGIADSSPIRLVALTGDISMEASASGFTSQIYLPKPARFVAGRDISGVRALVQNLTPLDVTTFAAGRDIVNPTVRAENGTFANNRRELLVAGPGRMEVIAGRDLALGSSNGLATVGNFRNPALAADGSDISITVGLQGRHADYDGFIERYLADSDDYDEALISYVELSTGTSGLTKGDALELFQTFDRSRQASLIEAVYFTELRDGGRFAASSVNSDYTRAFAALETLFPGGNPDLDAGEQNPYAGDVSLFFSRIYTLADGDVRIFAPGGAVNAGLATPPSGLGVDKTASELGIVVQRAGSVSAMAYADLLVNESRVFAADGGNILIWSTQGDIDAGRGAKTAISAPPPVITFDSNGNAVVSFPAALTGSGIQTLATSEGRQPGDVDLYAPRGIVNAGDAGIVAGNLTIGATAVLGADNIKVSGVAVGVPVDSGGFAAALTGVSAVASSASSAAEETVAGSRQGLDSVTPGADAALGFLEVFVLGFGDDEAEGEEEEEEEDQ